MSTEAIPSHRSSAWLLAFIRPLVSPIAAVLIAVAVGAILVAGVGQNPVVVYAILIEGGYALEKVTPIDQFRFSPHLETVALFRRPRAAKRQRRMLS